MGSGLLASNVGCFLDRRRPGLRTKLPRFVAFFPIFEYIGYVGVLAESGKFATCAESRGCQSEKVTFLILKSQKCLHKVHAICGQQAAVLEGNLACKSRRKSTCILYEALL